MTSQTPANERPRDPVCGMSVRIDAATADGLLAEHDQHTYYFCRRSCLDEFTTDPARFITSHHDARPPSNGQIVIDQGMRLWYESCSCCLSDAHPEVKAALDAERDAARQPQADAGICEVAEASS
jgi:YHS domain-containing protein